MDIPSHISLSLIAVYERNVCLNNVETLDFNKDPYVLPVWAVQSSHAHDCLDTVFPSDEVIIKAMSGVEPPWEELHHRSYFLPELDRLKREDFRAVLSQRVGSPMIPLSSPGMETWKTYLQQFLSTYLAILAQ